MAAALLQDGELVRLRSVALDEWLVTSPPDDWDDKLHEIHAISRTHLPDKYDCDGPFWESTGFIVNQQSTEGSGQLVRLAAARYCKTNLFAAPKSAKGNAATEEKVPVRARRQQFLEKKGLGTHSVFVVEDASTGDGAGPHLIRLRSQALPESYLCVSADEKVKVKQMWQTKKPQHAVLVVARSQLVEPLWDATVFEVTHEGLEVARARKTEAAEKTDTLDNLYIKRFIGMCVGVGYGIAEIVLVVGKDCPGVPGLADLCLAIGVIGLCEPIFSILFLMFAQNEIREGITPMWVKIGDGMIMVGGLSLLFAQAALAWPKGYRPNKEPTSYEEAVARWNATHFNSSSGADNTPPADLDWCHHEIVEIAFWGPIFGFVFAGIALVVLFVIWLDHYDKQEKAKKAAAMTASTVGESPKDASPV